MELSFGVWLAVLGFLGASSLIMVHKPSMKWPPPARQNSPSVLVFFCLVGFFRRSRVSRELSQSSIRARGA